APLGIGSIAGEPVAGQLEPLDEGRDCLGRGIGDIDVHPSRALALRLLAAPTTDATPCVRGGGWGAEAEKHERSVGVVHEHVVDASPELGGPYSAPERCRDPGPEAPDHAAHGSFLHGHQEQIRSDGSRAAPPHAYVDHRFPPTPQRNVFLARKKMTAPAPA